MTDPVYGDNPIDTPQLWLGSIVPPLANDPEMEAWRVATATLFQAIAEDQWLTRWRTAATTAEGVQLDELGEAVGYPRPDGYGDDRYRAILVALLPGIWQRPTPPVFAALLDALVVAPQTATMVEELPLAARFTFLETGTDDALNYFAALERIRPRGAQFFAVFEPPGGGDAFEIDTSTINGPDVIAQLLGP
jgi:hypothetical protein